MAKKTILAFESCPCLILDPNEECYIDEISYIFEPTQFKQDIERDYNPNEPKLDAVNFLGSSTSVVHAKCGKPIHPSTVNMWLESDEFGQLGRLHRKTFFLDK